MEQEIEAERNINQCQDAIQLIQSRINNGDSNPSSEWASTRAVFVNHIDYLRTRIQVYEEQLAMMRRNHPLRRQGFTGHMSKLYL